MKLEGLLLAKDRCDWIPFILRSIPLEDTGHLQCQRFTAASEYSEHIHFVTFSDRKSQFLIQIPERLLSGRVSKCMWNAKNLIRFQVLDTSRCQEP